MDEPSVSRPEQKVLRAQRLRSTLNKLTLFAVGIVVAFAALLLYKALYPGPHQLTTQDVNTAVAQTLASATPAPAYSVGVYQVIAPSLVLIQTQIPGQGGDTQGEHGLGSGVVIDDNGDILTSLHVIADATSIQLTFFDGTQSNAQVVDRQPDIDIATLRATNPPAQLIPAVLGNPNAMRVGDEAYAVGNPFGLYSSMSAGVISGFGRPFRVPNSNLQLKGLIQIDAAVNPGNSGGPLLNRAGEVIGIIEGIANPSGEDVFIGIGFAVPINVATSGMGLPPD